MNKKNSFHVDLLLFKPFRTLVKTSFFPILLQIIALVFIFVIVAIGLGHGTNLEPDQLKIFRKTNLSTLTVWGLWWPSMIAIALIFGRAWCTICPMELVNRIGNTIARKLNLPRAKLGKMLSAGWMTLAIYLGMQLLVSGLAIHRVPHFTAIMIISLLGLAFLTGLVFLKPRSFCQAFCPASALLSVYGRYTPLQLTKRDEKICDKCITKDCIDHNNRYKFDKRSCPSLIKPFDRKLSDDCVLCLQCVKVCPHDNMGFGIVSNNNQISKKVMLRPFEAAFVLIVMGFITHEVIGEIQWLDRYFHVIPKTLFALLPNIAFGWFEALWFLVLFPLVIWSVIGGLGYLFGHRSGLKTLLLAAATGAAPIVAIAHLSKAIAKMSSWGGYLPLSLRDPTGVETFNNISSYTLEKPAGFLNLSIIGWAMIIVMALIAWRALGWIKDMPRDAIIAARIGFVFNAAIFVTILSIWAWPIL